tara:strand:- start:169 stop:654 length:486 start_codon:yes stop_codon:yes gene_type:complete
MSRVLDVRYASSPPVRVGEHPIFNSVKERPRRWIHSYHSTHSFDVFLTINQRVHQSPRRGAATIIVALGALVTVSSSARSSRRPRGRERRRARAPDRGRAIRRRINVSRPHVNDLDPSTEHRPPDVSTRAPRLQLSMRVPSMRRRTTIGAARRVGRGDDAR